MFKKLSKKWHSVLRWTFSCYFHEKLLSISVCWRCIALKTITEWLQKEYLAKNNILKKNLAVFKWESTTQSSALKKCH